MMFQVDYYWNGSILTHVAFLTRGEAQTAMDELLATNGHLKPWVTRMA